MLRIEYVYWLVGAFLFAACTLDLRARRFAPAAFWGVIGLAFIGGDAIQRANADGVRWPAQAMGLGVIALGLLATRFRRAAPLAAAATRVVGDDDARGAPTHRAPSLDAPAAAAPARAIAGHRLFGPALAIPLLTLALVLGAKRLAWNGAPLLDPAQPTLVALGLACAIALLFALASTRARPAQALHEGHRLLDALGCFAVLPILLATLGSVFAATGVGDVIAALVGAVIPIDSRLACLAAFVVGMVLFTVIMGNAFAAFPVMMAGIGLPLLVQRHGADPAALGAVGMLTGYCGTLLTPMAANFNIVPAVLLELNDQYGVIRAQLPTALALLAFNVALLTWLMLR